MIASCGFLQNELSQFSKEEGVTLGRQHGNAWGGFVENKSQRSKEGKRKPEEVQGEVLDSPEEHGEPMRLGCLPRRG